MSEYTANFVITWSFLLCALALTYLFFHHKQSKPQVISSAAGHNPIALRKGEALGDYWLRVCCNLKIPQQTECCRAVGGWSEHYPNPACPCPYHLGVPPRTTYNANS
jgi:hypothetical protein